jgi:2-oxoglutarate dehydrogenase E1 component
MDTYVSKTDTEYIEELYNQYLKDPESVDASWRYFFEGVEFAGPNGRPAPAVAPAVPTPTTDTRVFDLVRAYRTWGHLLAKIDPLGYNLDDHPQLQLSEFGFDAEDLDREFPSLGLADQPVLPLRQIIEILQEIYCRKIGIEYMDLQNPAIERWFQVRIEPQRNRPDLTLETKRQILAKLNEAEVFEKFLQSKYPGQKRFSLEGAEAFIPAMGELIERSAELGVEEMVIGMAHRGRLNMLANILNKTYEMIFTEFEDHFIPDSVEGIGDVKYHKGFTSDYVTTTGRTVHLVLTPNPSHLEAVDPVVEGLVRAKQFMANDTDRRRAIPILIHGDASFSGQGVVAETLNLSQLRGYKTGGTIHIIINNQIGFTTDPSDARSTRYASDLAKMIDVPRLHVNGDDPEAVVHAIRLAVEFRQTFHRDIVIDLVCYRRHGHNETDEPSFTQPLMYKQIKDHPSVRSLYVDELIRRGDVEAELARKMEEEYRRDLQKALDYTRQVAPPPQVDTLRGAWTDLRRATAADFEQIFETKVPSELLKQIAERITSVPTSFHPHPKILRLLEERRNMVRPSGRIDWGMGEALAFGSLLWEGKHVRLSGQDSQRGTFSHRHAVLFDVEQGTPYIPLNHLEKDQAVFSVYNSPLSEYAVLGFDFGYSLANPHALVLWEAQFGDFINGAQVIVDQFISSSEAKWQRMSGLVLLLPHGYEGQGPEHSSARLERFLRLCGGKNIQVANPTTPAQYFHILRRQMVRPFRKPLVLMTPKSLLRHPLATSQPEGFYNDHFHEVLPDPVAVQNPKRVIFCSGKIYYELIQAREKATLANVSINRIEQYYPFPEKQLAAILKSYSACKDIAWVQEEPNNMGAWPFLAPRLTALLVDGQSLTYVGRPESASPATGSYKAHLEEQHMVVNSALGLSS